MLLYINKILGLIDSDKKRINIYEEPSDIFLLGFYYSKIEKWISINFKKEIKVLNTSDIVTILKDEDLYKFYIYILEIKKLQSDLQAKYMF